MRSTKCCVSEAKSINTEYFKDLAIFLKIRASLLLLLKVLYRNTGNMIAY